MADVKICRICLQTDAKMYRLKSYGLKSYYEAVLAYKVADNDGLPEYFCFECATILYKFHKFKEKCYTGQKVLEEMLWQGLITYEEVNKIDRKSLNLISTINITNAIRYAIKNDDNIKEEYTRNSEQVTSIVAKNSLPVKLENVDQQVYDDNEENFASNDDSSRDYDPVDAVETIPITIFVEDSTDCKVEELDVRESKRKPKEKQDNKKRDVKILKLIEEGTWEKISLSEEEALQEFRARSEEEKYKTAANKCTDCYKTFSKDEMLLRHKKIRHSESNGPFECQFCKMRFKWDCFLRKHMREHYTKYKCLRCNLICPLETTAILHEEYHTGMIKKCMHCNEEFRHPSTYYSHLRTHRSNHLCSLCGISFVSKIGLHQHKRKKHCTNDVENEDDDEDMNTFCARCDIRFETRKAYERHMFQSTAHANEEDEGKSTLRKSLEKKTQDKTNIKYEKRKCGSRKYRKPNKKPSTCHQCGKHFDTQAACLKHHLAEHPRTSFYSSTERHICEICGASLAPGSIAHHQNTHTRKTMYPCDSCGKQFNSYGGLKRHQVTHTGEKPFACSLCDKRFTQSNSMKLHYKTFHLKEPWPKRNRKKKKDNSHESEERESSDEDLKDFSEPKKAEKRIKSDELENPAMHVLQNADMQYLTIGY